jgi:hypothetical protein
MESKQLLPHGGVWKPKLSVALDSPKQCWIVTFKQVRRDDHDTIKGIHFLHQRVAVLIDRRGAGFSGSDALRKQTIGFIEEQHCVVLAALGKGQLMCFAVSPFVQYWCSTCGLCSKLSK